MDLLLVTQFERAGEKKEERGAPSRPPPRCRFIH
jgi:hypothetical protein